MGLIYGLRLVEGPCVVREYTSAATTTYDAGDVVSVANGSVGIGAHDAIAGVALKDAGAVTEMTPIIMITPDQIWNIGYATTTALDLIGDTYLMDFAPGAQYLTATTSTPTCIVVGLDARDGVKLYGRVNVRFLPSTCTFAGGVLA